MSSPTTSLATLRLENGALEIEVLPGVGARIHRLRAYGHDVLRTPADVELHVVDPFNWGAYHMVPWCNRIDAGPQQVGSSLVDLRSNFADGTVIHGQLYARPWREVDVGVFSARGGGDEWPWPYEATVTITLDGATLRVGQSVTNEADEAMPAGLGLHPWFAPETLLTIASDSFYPANLDSPPLPVPVSGAHDLRRPARMATGVDATWADPRRPAVSLRWPDVGLQASLDSDSPTLHITAALPTAVGALAVEPQTHAPQGLRRLLLGEPGALAWLAPGATLAHTIEMSFSRSPSANGG